MSKLESTITRPKRRRERVKTQARVHVVHPIALAATANLGDRLVVGRKGGGGGLGVDDPTVSREHLAFEWDGDELRVRDLESRNGTWVDGEKVSGEAVPAGDNAVVRAADVLLVVEKSVETDTMTVSRDAIPGDSSAVRRARVAVERAAPDRSPVLLLGETGTGKEFFAGEIHRLSGVKGPLVTVNCAAIARELVESQLFGHVRGAFTGAGEAQPGLFRAADGGTLFLDEIGELPLDLQPKLLRAIEEGELTPVGATKRVHVETRVVTATHQDLAAAVEAGRFRRDLYARLSLWEVHVPPLRERRADLFVWMQRLQARRRDRRADARTVPALEPEAAEALLLSHWPNNLRGVDRLLHELHGAAEPVTEDDLPSWLRSATASPAAETAKPGLPSRAEFEQAYEKLNGSVHALAKHFQRDRRQIYRWLEQYGLREKR